MSTPALGTIDAAGFPGPVRRNPDRPDASPETSRAVHADAVRLAYGQLRTSGVSLVCIAGLALAAMGLLDDTSSRHTLLSLLILPGVLAAAWTGQAAVELVKLRRTDPDRALQLEKQTADDEAAAVADIRERQLAVTPVVTYALSTTIIVVTGVQFITGPEASIDAAALVKPLVWQGEWWRLLSAAYLHGSVMHLLFNIGALRLLAGLIESHDRALRIPLVFLTAAIGGSLASTLFLAAPSLGASGGILGLAGYLLVAGRRQQTAAATWIRSQMTRILATTALYGIAGFFFIDNAAHAGGAFTGYLIGLATVPRPGRPFSAKRSRLIDQLSRVSGGLLLAGAIYTIMRLVQHG